MHSVTVLCKDHLMSPLNLLFFLWRKKIKQWRCSHLSEFLRCDLPLLVGVEEGEGLPEALHVLHRDLPVQTRPLAVRAVRVMCDVLGPWATVTLLWVTAGVETVAPVIARNSVTFRDPLWASWPRPGAWRVVALLAGAVVSVAAASVVVNWHFVLRYLKLYKYP